jgi:hypothetical protein
VFLTYDVFLVFSFHTARSRATPYIQDFCFWDEAKAMMPQHRRRGGGGVQMKLVLGTRIHPTQWVQIIFCYLCKKKGLECIRIYERCPDTQPQTSAYVLEYVSIYERCPDTQTLRLVQHSGRDSLALAHKPLSLSCARSLLILSVSLSHTLTHFLISIKLLSPILLSSLSLPTCLRSTRRKTRH